MTPTKNNSPTVRLAETGNNPGSNCLSGRRGVKIIPVESAPGLLVSFHYLKDFMRFRNDYVFRDWVMDSGAFSAHHSGVEIDNLEYIERVKELAAEDETLSEVYALDVINGDWKQGIKNCEQAWENGVCAIPTYHINEPDHVLRHYVENYPKVALGGVARMRQEPRYKWAEQCFARIWKWVGPKRIHGFGMSTEKLVMGLPFHSVDASTWEAGPTRFGEWKTYGRLSWKGSNQNLRVQVEWYLRLEQRARERWCKVMAEIESSGPAPTVRLASGSRPNKGGLTR